MCYLWVSFSVLQSNIQGMPPVGAFIRYSAFNREGCLTQISKIALVIIKNGAR